MINGIITDKNLCDYKIVLNTYGKLGFVYATFKDSTPKLYLKNLPTFKECIEYFLDASAPLLKMDKKQDICLSLFYNPYFSEFYEIIKECSSKMRRNRKRFLIKYLLSYLSDPLQFKGIVSFYDWEKEHYSKYDIFNRSRELVQILKR